MVRVFGVFGFFFFLFFFFGRGGERGVVFFGGCFGVFRGVSGLCLGCLGVQCGVLGVVGFSCRTKTTRNVTLGSILTPCRKKKPKTAEQLKFGQKSGKMQYGVRAFN